MSKITVNAVLTVIRLLASLLSKCIRLGYAVCDLVDDGCINASVPRPDWVVAVNSLISTLENLACHTSQIEDEVYKGLSDGK